jgi:regulator of nonsense transcripts 2
VALINQRQAAKEEQQRIKNLVLNYDLRESSEDHDGKEHPAPYGPASSTVNNVHRLPAAGTENNNNNKPISHHHLNRLDVRSGKDRGQRVRKLQLSDVDWYDDPNEMSLGKPRGMERVRGPRRWRARPRRP